MNAPTEPLRFILVDANPGWRVFDEGKGRYVSDIYYKRGNAQRMMDAENGRWWRNALALAQYDEEEGKG